MYNNRATQKYRGGACIVLLGLLSGSAIASNTGSAVTGTMLSDPGSGFTVDVTGNSGASFGTITLINDALSFTPAAGFNTGVLTGDTGIHQLTGTITLLLAPDSNGGTISATALQEIGDYWLDNSGGTAQTIGASFQLIARAASGTITSSQVIQNTNSANTQGPSPLGATGAFNNTNWGLAGSLSAGTPLGWVAQPNGDVIVTIQDNLFYDIGAGNSGFIEKKDLGMTLDVSVVPLPASVWLLLSALVGLAGFRGALSGKRPLVS